MPKSCSVPEPLAPLFDEAEGYVERRFANFKRSPERGEIRVDGERFVLVRAESLFAGLSTAFARRFGDEAAANFIYTMAWEIGRSDCETLTARAGAQEPTQKLAAGPPFFAHCGWAGVVILDDSNPTSTDDCLLHYHHPNTFESEAAGKRPDLEIEGNCCFFSAGYSAGWVSCCFGTELHAREIRCRHSGAHDCEFVMAPERRLADYVAAYLKSPS